MNVLCVDDDPVTLKTLGHTLQRHCCAENEIYYAEDGETAIRIFQEVSVDVVITDLVMPGMSGIDVLTRMKHYKGDTEIIVLTGKGSIETAVEAMKRGARDYLTKPVNNWVLVEKLDTIRELHMRSSEAEEYRFAKEKIERCAQHDISQMEIKINTCIETLEAIEKQLDTDQAPAQKCAAIRERLERFHTNQCTW